MGHSTGRQVAEEDVSKPPAIWHWLLARRQYFDQRVYSSLLLFQTPMATMFWLTLSPVLWRRGLGMPSQGGHCLLKPLQPGRRQPDNVKHAHWQRALPQSHGQ